MKALLPQTRSQVERVDGTQARLKRSYATWIFARFGSGKGGWDSGEIETFDTLGIKNEYDKVERVDGTQARLKPGKTALLQSTAAGWEGRRGGDECGPRSV